MNKPGDVVQLKNGRTYLYCGQYEEGCLYVLVALSGMPVSESIVLTHLYQVAQKRKDDYSILTSKPKFSGKKLFNIDLSGHQILLKGIWRLNKCQ